MLCDNVFYHAIKNDSIYEIVILLIILLDNVNTEWKRSALKD